MSGLAVGLLMFAGDAGADGGARADRDRDVRPRRGRLHRPGEQCRVALPPEGRGVRAAQRLRPVGDPAVPAHRPVRDPRRASRRSLFRLAAALVGHFRGGLAMAVDPGERGLRRDLRLVGGHRGHGDARRATRRCAATATRGRLATATLAVGGTMGILMPPSVILIIYAILTEQNIAKLFAAALVPGLIAVVGYLVTIAVYVPPASGGWPRRSRGSSASDAGRDAEGRLADRGHLRARLRRHLRRRVHADRGRRRSARRSRSSPASLKRELTCSRHPRVLPRHRRRQRHDLHDLPRRRHAERGAGAVADARAARRLASAHLRRAAAGDRRRDPAHLHPARLRDGRAVDDPADDPGAVPRRDGARPLRPRRRPTRRSGSASSC